MSDVWEDIFNSFMYELEDAIFWRDTSSVAAFTRIGATIQRAKDRAEKAKLTIKKTPELILEDYPIDSKKYREWAPIQNRNDEHMRDWEPLQRGENHWPVDGGNDRIA
jgi:hypothetical protein